MGEYRDRAKMQREAEKSGWPPSAATRPSLRLSTAAGGERYLIETEDGTLTPVSAERLNAWAEQRSRAGEPSLNSGEERMLDRLLSNGFGGTEK